MPAPLLPDFTGLILDGGRATRLGGAHKAFLEVDGGPIAERTTALFHELFGDVLVATRWPDAWAGLGVRCLADPVQGAGPLAGIAAGLAACKARYLFVVAGDMPALDQEVVLRICTTARDHDRAAVPVLAGRPEPLHAAYLASSAPIALAALDRGVRRVTDFLDLVPVTWMPPEAFEGITNAKASFRNVNTPDDLGS